MKKFSSVKALVLLSFFVFTVMCSGGCGGSSTSTGTEEVTQTVRVFSIGEPDDVDNKDSLMYAFMVIFRELLGTTDDLSTITSKDALIVFSFDESDSDDIVDSLKKEAAVILLCPTRAIIQKLVDVVGMSDYKVPEISKGEIFAIKQTNNGADLFYMPSQASLLLDSESPITTVDSESRDVTFVRDTREAVTPEPESSDDFHQQRFNDFIDWLNMSNDQTVSASDFNTSTSILKGTMDCDFSYTGSADQYGTPRHNWKAYYTVYALHSFADGCDYYIVELRSRNNPRGQFSHAVQTLRKKPSNDTIEVDCSVDVANGYTRQLSLSHSFLSDDNGDIEVIAAAPSANAGTNSFNWDLGGQVAYSWPNAGELSNHLESRNTVRYTTNLANDRNNVTFQREEAKWNLYFDRPADGIDYINDDPYAETTDYTKTYKGLNVRDASVQLRTNYFAWIWRVPKDYWQEKGSPKFFQSAVTSVHGRTEGMSYYSPVQKVYRVPRVDMDWYRAGKTVNIPLPKPPHIAISGNLEQHGNGAYYCSTYVCSEEDWTATADKDWLTLDKTSGSATGGVPELVRFTYTANNTGEDRQGTITFKSNQSGESVVFYVYQSK